MSKTEKVKALISKDKNDWNKITNKPFIAFKNEGLQAEKILSFTAKEFLMMFL